MIRNGQRFCASRLMLTAAIGLAFGLPTTLPAGAQEMADPAPQTPMAGPSSVADLAEGLLDSVVNISTSQQVDQSNNTPMPQIPEGSPFQDFFDEFFGEEGGPTPPVPRSRRVNSLGSGFVISEDGLIVTNNHVIEQADEVEVNFADGSSLTAEIVGTDPKTDLALLQVDPAEPLDHVEFGDSETMRIGDWVMAIGNPFGLGGSVSIGIVSARGRNINAGPYDDFIQTDAAINRGNSGGPLFNMRGEVIGINTAIISPTGGSIGIGFSVPSELAINVIDQLREFGETRRGWLGVRIQPVTDEIAESLDMQRARGALVAGVINGGPVDDGTIEPGDVILEFDGTPIDDMRDLPRIVAESPVGDEVDVLILRNGEETTVKVTLGRLEDGEDLAEATTSDDGGEAGEAPEDSAVELLGLSLDELTEDRRTEFSIGEDVEGVLIAEVDPESEAADKEIAAGEVIVEIAQESVSTPDEAQARIDALREEGRRNALLMIANASGELRFVTLRMD
ncbi:DegQ family serine endoprotease [Pararhizobium haloflavum]|uniref:DegQ family serine endoprotease n=1 Tax=Pararhizobium haloflavum TaxID=2037914 RepID=UPI0035213076